MATEPDSVGESFQDWQSVHLPAKDPSSSSAASSHDILVAGIRPPPIDHQIDQSSPTPSLSGGSEIGDSDSGKTVNGFKILKSGIAWVTETARRCAVGRRGAGLWSCVVVAAAAILMYGKLVKWRRRIREETANRFLLVIREQDETMRRLMLQIARLNQMLRDRRRVVVVPVPVPHYNLI